MTDNRQPAELFEYMGSDDFRARCASVRAELDRDPNALSVEEIAARLGLPEGFLVAAAGSWLAAETGQPVTIFPPRRGGTH